MRYCGNCRNQLHDNATVCPRCGVPQVRRAPPSQQQRPQGGGSSYYGQPRQDYGRRPPQPDYRGYYQQQRPPQQQAGGYPPRPPSAAYPTSQATPRPQTQGQPPPRAQPQQQPSYAQPRPQAVTQYCPRCGAGMRYIADYSSFYCDRCMEYQKPRTSADPANVPSPASDPIPVPEPREDSNGDVNTWPLQQPSSVPGEQEAKEDLGEFRIEEIVDEEDEAVLETRISKALKQVKNILAEKDGLGFDVTELQELYRQCGNVFAADDFYTATHYLERIKELLDELEGKEPETGEDVEVPEIVQAPSVPVRDVGSTDTDFDGIDDLDDLDKNESYDDDVVVVKKKKEPIDEWDILDKPEMGEKEKAVQALESAKSAIMDADGDGYDMTNAKKLFKDARPLYESQRFNEVVDKVKEVEREVLKAKGHSETEIEEILGETLEEDGTGKDEISDKPEHAVSGSDFEKMSNDERNELIGMINKVWIPLREASRYNLDITAFEDLLEQAKNKESFQQAKVLVESVDTEVKAKLSKYKNEQHDKASNMFHYLRSEIQSATKLDIDVQPFRDQLDDASTGISLGNYENAIEIMNQCLDELKTATKTVAETGQVTAEKASTKSQPVWDTDDEDEDDFPEETERTTKSGSSEESTKKELTDEKRLEILEDRFILGEISEKSYRELKDSILKRLKK